MYEVNEAVMARRYASLKEQLQVSTRERLRRRRHRGLLRRSQARSVSTSPPGSAGRCFDAGVRESSLYREDEETWVGPGVSPPGFRFTP